MSDQPDRPGAARPEELHEGVQRGAYVQARRRARREALGVLFEAELRGRDAVTLFTEHIAAGVNLTTEGDLEVAAEAAGDRKPPRRRRRRSGAPVFQPYASAVVEGVWANKSRIDEALQTYARGWTLDRMPRVDRTVLRIGAWEILFEPELAPAVAITEALRLVREYSTAESPAFVHGLLGRIAEQRETLLA